MKPADAAKEKVHIRVCGVRVALSSSACIPTCDQIAPLHTPQKLAVFDEDWSEFAFMLNVIPPFGYWEGTVFPDIFPQILCMMVWVSSLTT